MRLLFISIMEGFKWGGSEELWYETASYALQNGHRVITLSKSWEQVPVKIVQLQQKSANSIFYSNYSGIDKKNKIKKLLGISKANLSLSESLKQAVLQKPDAIIINQGGTFDVALTSDLYEYLKSSLIPYIILCPFLYDFGSSVSKDMSKKITDVFYRAKNICFVANRNLIAAERMLGYNITNAKVINWPVNITSKKFVPYPKIENDFSLACVARLDVAYKGQDYLLQVFSQAKWKERSWKLLLYGDGPDKEIIKTLIIFYGLEDKVLLMGHINNISDIWATSHLLILPSIGEGTPISLADAMLCGRTAVVTAAGGNSELIENNITGFVAACALPEYLDEALEVAWEKRDSWEDMGLKAFLKASARYKNNAGEKLLEMIQHCI